MIKSSRAVEWATEWGRQRGFEATDTGLKGCVALKPPPRLPKPVRKSARAQPKRGKTRDSPRKKQP